ncbi:MAG: NAD-dependent DNA ligase LigA [Prevotella sp.]|nr:NAD-dependent DNA ligase LigA [Prevotella sp.]
MQQLVEELNRASDAYYNGRQELMTDYEWDARFDELKRLETETGTSLPDSPTQRVSEDNTAGQKEEHEFPALSLAKTKQVGDLVKWAEGRPIWISWKLDGLTLVVTYDHGRLQKVVTRGNGHIGTNITHLAHAISGIPQRIAEQGHIVIRGEAVIAYDDFNQFLIESGEDYANPRNLASGSLSLKDPEEVKPRKIQWIPFTLVSREASRPTPLPLPIMEGSDISQKVQEVQGVQDNSWGARMAWLDTLGFNTVERVFVETPTEEIVQAVIDHFTRRLSPLPLPEREGSDFPQNEGQQAESHSTPLHNREGQGGGSAKAPFPYPVDGLVITYDDTAFAATGSVTGHHATRAGLAFKWQDEAAETELQEIEWSCAASTISPVAIFRPVELEGTTVKRASLCNISECERLGIGDRGTRLSVIKANKIIPKVIKVTETVGALHIPEQCPVCHQATEIVVSQQSGTRTLHCTNPTCPAKQLKKYARFVSKAGMDIDGISEQTLARFINLGWISNFADIYRLPNHIREIAALEGFGERSAANIVKSVEKAREVDAQRLLIALSIPKCGADVAKRLLGAYAFNDLVETASTTCDNEHFAHIDGIGPERSALIVGWFHDEANTAVLQQLLGLISVRQQQQQQAGNQCEGLTFVITGDVHHFQNRNALKAFIEARGGRVAGSVSGSTSFLINNDVASTSGKNKKAKELGIPILSEDDFLSRFSADEGNTTAPAPQQLALDF